MWGDYDITQEELIYIIEEGVLTAHDRRANIRQGLGWRYQNSIDLYLDDVSFEPSEIEESAEYILRTLRPHKFRSTPKEIEDSTQPEPEIAEEVAVDNKDIEIVEGQKSERTAEFDQAVLELMEAEPEISKSEIVERKKHLYPGYVTDGAIRKHLVKFQKEHSLYKKEQPGAKKRT